MRGEGRQRVAQRAFKQWRKLHFDHLFDSRHLSSPLHATLRLPVTTTGAATPSTPPSTSALPSAAIDLQLSTNHRAVVEWWHTEYGTFLSATPNCREESTPVEGADISVAPPVIASSRVVAHVGPPAAPFGYPAYISAEAEQWTAGVLRGEAYSYQHADVVNGLAFAPPPPADAPYLQPVRWIQQPLLDGFVAQRLTAHAGVTTGALLDARRSAAALGRQLPPFDLSPFYASHELLDRWCIFGEPSALLPSTTTAAAGPTPVSSVKSADAAGHHRRAAELALAAAVLPSYKATWLNGAVVSNKSTRKCVLIVGPRSSGKTTLALHCIAPTSAAPTANNSGSGVSGGEGDAHVQLTAAEHFFLGAGTPVQRMLHAPPPTNPDVAPQVFICALPHRVKVGIGAVLGTLRPNPALAATTALPGFLRTDADLRAFLTNTDRGIWEMSMHYHVALHDLCSRGAPSPWQPAGINALAGVVMLSWNTDELASTAPVPVRTRVRHLPLHAGGLQELLTRGRDYLFHGHYLLRSVYDEAVEGPARLAGLLDEEWAAHPPAAAAPALHCVEGSVNFDAATQLVRRLLAA
ncbi:hypothetical protein ABL78_7041 [Leptomonas seymouri]|uniref:Uncharacterized protein n=1 Tax=Leptomonas seymouri TaxID=5684 RepID=A0A0N1HSY5_LEPSE|nr:hypothetical protein ABL78_7041 [Leptomonas seymouri]|eukprot:KPI83923.1 hypothetical protein ABL78_7041 [Leptomonas seymouri]